MAYRRYQLKKRKLALVIPAHNEEVVIGATIASAITAGMLTGDIFVVSDGSSDRTVEIATNWLGKRGVLDQPQSGKAKAILHAIEHFDIVERYEWLHIADADGVFSPTYFQELQKRLSRKYVAATGYITSLPGGLVSQYRTYEYTYGLEVMRRIQAFFGVIPVIPGPTSVFRTDILRKLDFTVDVLIEDMDITMQLHRLGLGKKIAYIPQAKTYTQDPKDLGDFIKQVSRWYRGSFQVFARHKVGRRLQAIDAYLFVVLAEQWLMTAELVALPIYALITHNFALPAAVFLADVALFLSITLWASGKTRRADVLSAFPLFYVLRLITLFIFIRSWYEIVVQRKFRSPQAGWNVAGRRYRIVTDAASN